MRFKSTRHDNIGQLTLKTTAQRVREAMRPQTVSLVALLSLAPFLSFLNHNRSELIDGEAPNVLRYGSIVALTGILILLAVSVILARVPTTRIAAMLGVVMFLSFNFHWYSVGDIQVLGFELGAVRTQLLVWLMVAAIGGGVTYALASRPTVVSYLVIVAVIFAALPAADYIWYLRSDPQTIEYTSHNEGTTSELQSRQVLRPNIYLFVPDAYPSNELLDVALGFDNSAFAGELEERGFLYQNSYANYPLTSLSIASVLEMDYIGTTGGDFADGARPFRPMLRGDSRFVRTAQEMGYEYVHAEPGNWSGTRCASVTKSALCIRSDDGLASNELEHSLLTITPLDAILRGFQRGPYGVPEDEDDAFGGFATPTSVTSELLRRIDEVQPPFFFFSHLINPHPPYRYQADCTPQPGAPIGGIGGPWWVVENAEGLFVEQIQCLNGMLLEAIDAVLRVDPNAVVVIAADHGMWFPSEQTNDFEALTGLAAAGRFSAFLALRLPEQCGIPGEEIRTLVNTFRVVGACMGWYADEYLPHRMFRAWYGSYAQTDEWDLGVFDNIVEQNRR